MLLIIIFYINYTNSKSYYLSTTEMMKETYPLDAISTTSQPYNIEVSNNSTSSETSSLTSPGKQYEGRNNIESDLQDNQTNEQVNDSSQRLMTKVLKLIQENKCDEILKQKTLHLYFLKKCVVIVTGKRRWKENAGNEDYDMFVHPSDESFAMLVLENNILRYKDMVKHKSTNPNFLSTPRYTTVTRKGQKTMSRGWSDVGKLRYKKLTKMIIEMRSKDEWIKDRRKYIKRKCSKHKNQKRKRIDDNDYNYQKQMNQEEKNTWDNFIYNSINDLNWGSNTVAL